MTDAAPPPTPRHATRQGILDLTAQQSHLRVPFLLCHGTGDRVTSFHGSEALLRCAESADKELRLYPEVRAPPAVFPPPLSLSLFESSFFRGHECV